MLYVRYTESRIVRTSRHIFGIRTNMHRIEQPNRASASSTRIGQPDRTTESSNRIEQQHRTTASSNRIKKSNHIEQPNRANQNRSNRIGHKRIEQTHQSKVPLYPPGPVTLTSVAARQNNNGSRPHPTKKDSPRNTSTLSYTQVHP